MNSPQTKPEDYLSQDHPVQDHIGAYAEAFFLANLLFVGVFYLLLWGLYFVFYKRASRVSKNHIKQTLVASTLSTLIVIILNIVVVLTSGYASAAGLLLAEVYLMLIVPLFMIVGILGFIKAVNDKNYSYPLMVNLVVVDGQDR